jgi:hypothetical protein
LAIGVVHGRVEVGLLDVEAFGLLLEQLHEMDEKALRFGARATGEGMPNDSVESEATGERFLH